LRAQIAAQREDLIRHRKLKRAKPLPGIAAADIPYAVPESWQWHRLGDACLNVTDGFHNTPRTHPTGIPYLTATHVKSEGLDFDNGLFVSDEDHEELVSKTRPKKHDVLVVNIGVGCATPAVIDVDFEFSFKNVAILNRPDGLEHRYLFNFLLATKEATFADRTKGGAQPFLSLRELRIKLFPLPPLAEQKRIVAKVDQLLSQIDELSARWRERQSTTHGLLTATLHALLERA
jgi:type I restriction enzyme S subunit